MWFRAREGKDGNGDPASDGAARPDADGGTHKDAHRVPKLPPLPSGCGSVTIVPGSKPRQGLDDMWESVADPAAFVPASPRRNAAPVVALEPSPPQVATPPKPAAPVAPASRQMASPRPQAPRAAAPAKDGAALPAGFLIVTNGPGRGAHFALQEGVSHIGRGPDEDVSLNFGDTAISRSCHATVAYDTETRAFFVGPGVKKYMLRLNGRPVLTTEQIFSHDVLRLGDTSLTFLALCGDAFEWTSSEGAA